MSESESQESSDFIRTIVANDVAAGKNDGRVVTRFPPEPNGYLHIGHAKAICLNYGVAQDFGGTFHLRFDDTNPSAEDEEFVESIQRDVAWLGCDWGEHLYYTSDYFPRLHEFAVELIRGGNAYVCDWSSEQFFANRGTLTEPMKASPGRSRPIEESLALFEGMKNGEFEEGAYVVRAKIDLASSVLPMRDPVIYRIQKARHHRSGDDWCIYPMYDFAHCLSDSIEHITHSLCSLEFADHRPLYDWFIEKLDTPSTPRQYEFARLNLSHTIMSKRMLRQLVESGVVAGWDDPRMPTLAGMRRRGYPPEAIRSFAKGVGVAKRENVIQLARLEFSVRDRLNEVAPRRLAVLRPLKVVIENYPEGQVEEFDAVNHPNDPEAGTRKVPFSRTLYVERDDFMEEPVRKFFRLAPGREVRLRFAYLITCNEVVKDDHGEVVELRCSYDPETRGGDAPDGRKVKGTLHWVSESNSVAAEVRLYDTLYSVEDPAGAEEGKSHLDFINPASLEVLDGCRVEPSLASAAPADFFQFERLGYFCVDSDSAPEHLVFNRSVTLRDAWAKVARKKGG